MHVNYTSALKGIHFGLWSWVKPVKGRNRSNATLSRFISIFIIMGYDIGQQHGFCGLVHNFNPSKGHKSTIGTLVWALEHDLNH